MKNILRICLVALVLLSALPVFAQRGEPPVFTACRAWDSVYVLTVDSQDSQPGHYGYSLSTAWDNVIDLGVFRPNEARRILVVMPLGRPSVLVYRWMFTGAWGSAGAGVALLPDTPVCVQDVLTDFMQDRPQTEQQGDTSEIACGQDLTGAHMVRLLADAIVYYAPSDEAKTSYQLSAHDTAWALETGGDYTRLAWACGAVWVRSELLAMQ